MPTALEVGKRRGVLRGGVWEIAAQKQIALST